jgi:hypothetical protein
LETLDQVVNCLFFLPCVFFWDGLLPPINSLKTTTKAVPKPPALARAATTRLQVVFYAAVFRAFDMAKSRTNDAIQSMQKGQLVLLGKNDPWLRTNVPAVHESGCELKNLEFRAAKFIP